MPVKGKIRPWPQPCQTEGEEGGGEEEGAGELLEVEDKDRGGLQGRADCKFILFLICKSVLSCVLVILQTLSVDLQSQPDDGLS